MISGARNSNKRFKRLLRLITRRYKSFKSEVAKRPPSNGTNGRNSGGITGNTSNTIHSGREPDSKKDSTNFKRFTIFLRFISEVVSISSARKLAASPAKSIWLSISLMASAPIPTRKASSPYSSKAC